MEALNLYVQITRGEAKISGSFDEKYRDGLAPKLDNYLRRFQHDKKLYLSVLQDIAVFYERVNEWMYSSEAINHTLENLVRHFDSEINFAHFLGEEPPEAERNELARLFHSTNEVLTEDQRVGREHLCMFVNMCIKMVCDLQLEAIDLYLLAQSEFTLLPLAQTSEAVTDGNGNVVAVVVNGRFQWLCGKNEIMRIVRSLHSKLGIAANSHKALAELAANLAPDVAQGVNFISALTQASKDVSNPQKPELAQGEINVEEAASKVLPYLRRYL